MGPKGRHGALPNMGGGSRAALFLKCGPVGGGVGRSKKRDSKLT
eukprot:CAMPEP_0114501920 /NCGR_PEP_ID=MMETSP0109-20121206/8765_1 /TAXON_ID=29199 /ORGANISM="Chlorarachnion reptans, Strain CCCM449" /LENGTH=43 /DNA_ID= /DNA_START= /DNA_END= /DNA_ORIENTATION=